MIEDELRTLLRTRAEEPPDNPTRVASVHSRIATTRRRRASGGALALVLLALAGLFVVRLPGTDDSLPPGVPAPPYFDRSGKILQIQGYSDEGGRYGFEGSNEISAVEYRAYFRHLIVVRCEQRGDLTARNRETGEQVVVACGSRVDDHFEGIAAVSVEQAQRLFAYTDELANVLLDVDSPGEWSVSVLKARAPEKLSDRSDPDGYLVDGRRTPAGTTVDFVPSVPPLSDDPPPDGGWGFTLQVECVAGVRLLFRVPAGELGQVHPAGEPGRVDCDPDDAAMTSGFITLSVTGGDMRRLGLTYGRKVRLTVVRSGAETDQWRVSALG